MTDIWSRGGGEVHIDRAIASDMEKRYTDLRYGRQRSGKPVRKGDPQTSHDAVPDEKSLNASRRAYFDVVRQREGRGATTAEVSKITGIATNSLNSRPAELCRSGHIVIALINEDGVMPKMKGKNGERVTIDEEEVQSVKAKDTRQMNDKKLSILNRYRPDTWEDLLGHKEQIAEFRQAKGHHQVFLLTGISGVGKTTFARLAAKDLGVEVIREENSANCNGVDDMRELFASFSRNSLLASSQAIILDEVHRLSQPAWDVATKPLEEPPDGSYVFLVTPDPSRIPATIKTRALPLHLQAVSNQLITRLLEEICDAEAWQTPDEVIGWCAGMALGSPRRAILLLTGCHGLDTRDEAAARMHAVREASGAGLDLGFQLSQALREPRLAQLQLLLTQGDEAHEHPDTLRQVVRSYYKKVTLTSKDVKQIRYARDILAQFEEPMSDYTSLVLAVTNVFLGVTSGKE